ncbi:MULTISPECIES: YceK/YidQ family lipoprotein [unclassified Pseudomonas]|uniref:YceK/YidQ family lipoprotein n=1 Tax=unclassified Pseudomonas TaxID=196821 RepID=UPI0014760AA9|nr:MULTISPECIES: YceK/YidQ family lipoprotein [unclassified Pseudomonas]NMX90404.1 YceK/YidQ family lipoprotein [Pseudomonas sp. WS 5086]NMY44451.1 YceK/YidQ family lipoprotein [Pseudomonas sp. WS 5027]
MNMKVTTALSVMSLMLSGCGTVNTVLRDDLAATRELRKQKTYCQSIPRVYSGVAFDFCLLNAQPDFTGVLVPAVLVDIVASGAVDTVLLPYTIYRQSTDGNIGIYWQARRS